MPKKTVKKPKRGAPKKEVCRTARINIAVTADEKEQIINRATAAGFSEHTIFARMLLLGKMKPKK